MNPVIKNMLVKSIECLKKLGISESAYIPITRAVNYGLLDIPAINQCLQIGMAVSIPSQNGKPEINYEKYLTSIMDFLTKMKI